jgi:hypothetical protein
MFLHHSVDVGFKYKFSERDIDFIPPASKASSQGSMDEEEADIDKVDEGLRRKLIDTAPRSDMVGCRGGFVNRFAKPKRFLVNVIQKFSNKGDTVLDFFSGGQVLRSAILCGRECFVYSLSKQEGDLMQEYGRVLTKALWNGGGLSVVETEGLDSLERLQIPTRETVEPEVDPVDFSQRLHDRAQGVPLDGVDDTETIPPFPTGPFPSFAGDMQQEGQIPPFQGEGAREPSQGQQNEGNRVEPSIPLGDDDRETQTSTARDTERRPLTRYAWGDEPDDDELARNPIDGAGTSAQAGASDQTTPVSLTLL